MNSTDHQRIIIELDALSSKLIALIQRFEATGFNAILKDDYVELHALQYRIIGQRLHHSKAIGATPMPFDIPPERH